MAIPVVALLLALSASPSPQPPTETATTEASPTSPDDALFPGAGRAAVSLGTGVPYLAIGEAAYGVTDRFAIGALGGVTPFVWGAGLRARGVLHDGGSLRLVLVSPVLYYPPSAGLGNEPWILAMPSLLAEHRFAGGAAVHVGAGAAAAACTGAIGSLATMGTIGHEHADGQGFMGDVWGTATLGGSLPIAHSTVMFTDASALSGGLAFGRPWIGGPPLVLIVGVRRAL
ncbi:MAG: hypothetical protein ACYCWW_17850 [Deltaproteobacteria bacterium]